MCSGYHFFKVLAHPMRIRILELLSEGEKNVNQMQALLGIEASAVSQQLAVLRGKGIVDVKKEPYQKEMVCILVDNDEHLYLTNDYIVTHNTSSVKGLISLMEDNNLTYTLLSPTGKAARILSESTGRKAYTIHKRCFSGDIDTDVIIVDECGMVSLDVFYMLLTSISNTNARIVFVGDPAQLSSIGLSKIFDDLIKSSVVPMTMLTEVFRYKSDGSLFVATNVRQGKNFFNDKEFVKYDDSTLEYSVNDNYRFILTDDILNRTVTEYKKLLQKGIKKENIFFYWCRLFYSR